MLRDVELSEPRIILCTVCRLGSDIFFFFFFFLEGAFYSVFSFFYLSK